MKKVFIFLLVTTLILSFIGTGYFLYLKAVKPAEIHKVVQPFYTDITRKTVASGTITPRKEIDMKSQVSGVVEKLYAQPGDQVKSGQILARIKIIPDVVMLNNAEMRLKAAVINFTNAEKEYQRQKLLFDDKVISEQDFLRFFLDYQLQQQELEAAENNLELIREGASLKAGTASNVVISTASGMVLDMPVKEGSFVIESNTFNEGTTIATVADMGDLIFEGNVDESEVGKLLEGMTLNLIIGALDREGITAELEYISPKGVELEGSIQFEIRAAVQLPDDIFLRAGYSANAEIILDQRQNVLAVNESDIITDKGKVFVEIEKGYQQFSRKEIKTGLSDGINIEILDGLIDADKIKSR
ncbi:MAG: efflux RND transporter periplasmic adaptor subunit [Cyclobacteriaceae bacterium]|nr:efflux RND transporter periplasmic adaptor subunit [Cyclobacteriaceae bacterium]